MQVKPLQEPSTYLYQEMKLKRTEKKVPNTINRDLVISGMIGLAVAIGFICLIFFVADHGAQIDYYIDSQILKK